MKKLSPYYLLVLLATCFSFASQAQLTITPGSTAAAMAAKLAGPGVIIIAPTLTCPTPSRGLFTGTSTLAFDSGLVMSSGDVIDAANPASFFASTDEGAAGDAQLTALAGQPTFDACVLQFDFRPTGDTVKFNYAFGSEEYASYTCSPYNDVFGFFISGPGYGAPTNLAVVPGTSIPVCINSVNCGATGGWPLSTCTAVGPGSPFCTYYINNSTGTTIAYNGLTTTLTAIATVTPCDTYHLKIGIADGTDHVYDSGVFLEAGSLTSNSFTTTPYGMNPADTAYGAQYCVRGCVPGMFIFHNTGSLADTLTIHYIISGTAVNGVDYTTIADSVVIPAHDSVDTVFIHGLVIPPTGPKTVTLYILAPYTCGGVATIIDSVQLTILDSFRLKINTNDTAICLGQTVHILTTTDTLLDISWAPAATLSSDTARNPFAMPVVTTTYTITGTFTGCAPSEDHITVTVYEKPTLDVGPPIVNTCVGVPVTLHVTATPSGVPYGYSWSPGTYLSSPGIASPVATPTAVGDILYHITVAAPVPACFTVDSVTLHVLPNDFALINQDTGVCFPPSTYSIFINGSDEFSYSWDPTVGVSDPTIKEPTISPTATTVYTVTANYPGCPTMKHTLLYSIEHPDVNIITTDSTVCIGEPIVFPIIITPIDSPYTFFWSSPTAVLDGLTDPTIVNTKFFSPVPGSFKYYLTITSGLGCTSTDSVTFNPAPPIQIGMNPAVAYIKYGEEVQLEAINNSPYPLMYFWTPDNGTLSNPNISNPIARPTDSTTHYTVYAMNEWGCGDTAYATVYVDADMDECIPTAFTPNGDHRNDVFRLCDMTNRKLVDFRVFNRWGEVVYRNVSGDTRAGWDGTWNGQPQDMGVYQYMVIIAKPDGTQKVYKGDVTLVR